MRLTQKPVAKKSLGGLAILCVRNGALSARKIVPNYLADPGILWFLATFGDSLKRHMMCSGARQVREDPCCPHGTASPACTTLARTVLRRLAAPPRMPRYPCRRPHHTVMPVATDMTTPRRRAPVTGHLRLPPGPASRGEPARSGGARDRDAPGQTCGASPS